MSAFIGGALGTESSPDDFTEYQYEMIRTLADVRQDANACGWYESTHHGNSFSEGMIENQYQFQKVVPNAVCIIYDSFQLKVGKCGFAAYRLSDAAFRRRKRAEDEEEDDVFKDFPSENLLERVPIKVQCSPLVESLLLQYQTTSFDALDTDTISPALERNVQLLLESLDEFSLQQREMQLYERQTRNAKKDMQAKNLRTPKTVDTLNLSKQIQAHCKSIDDQAADSFGKLYMVSDSNDVKNVMQQLKAFQHA